MSGIEELDRIPPVQTQTAPNNVIEEDAMDIDERPGTNSQFILLLLTLLIIIRLLTIMIYLLFYSAPHQQNQEPSAPPPRTKKRTAIAAELEPSQGTIIYNQLNL